MPAVRLVTSIVASPFSSSLVYTLSPILTLRVPFASLGNLIEKTGFLADASAESVEIAVSASGTTSLFTLNVAFLVLALNASVALKVATAV